MGSLPAPPPPPLPQNSHANFRIYASFCRKCPSTDGGASTTCNWVESYNPSDNTWHCLGPIPGLAPTHLLKAFSMVAVRDSFYIIGGRLCQKEPGADPTLEADLAVLPTVLRYNITANEWSRCAPLRTPRFDFACTAYDDKIYVAGGKSALGTARGVPLAEVYDPALDEWSPLPNMSTLRHKCVGVTWQGKIYVVGGFAERCDSDRTVPFATERSSAEVYDTWKGEWNLMQRMWQLDVPPNQIVAIGNKLYSSGDCLNTWKGHIESYDGKVNIWNMVEGSHRRSFVAEEVMEEEIEEEINEITTIVQRIYLTMVAIERKLYFVAGHRVAGEAYRSKTVVHAFDTSAEGEGWMSNEATDEEGEKQLCSHCCAIQLISS